MQAEAPDAKLLREMREALFGREDAPQAKFHTHWELDVAASHKAGKRIERPTPYITLIYPESRHSQMSKRATKAQIAKFHREFALYEQEIRHGNQDPYEGWQDVPSDETGQSHGDMGGDRVVFAPVRTRRGIKQAG